MRRARAQGADLSHLHELARIASFACAGLVLLSGSWGYHRLERRLAAAKPQPGS